MFYKFTARARRVVAQARQEAYAHNNEYIGTAHLLLGLIHDSDDAVVTMLQALGADPGRIRDQVEKTIGPVHRAVPSDLSVTPHTPQAKRALDRSIYEAQRRGHDSVDAEHILYSLIGQTNCAAAKALMTVGANPARILQQVFQIWGIPTPGDPPNSSNGGAPLKRRPPRW